MTTTVHRSRATWRRTGDAGATPLFPRLRTCPPFVVLGLAVFLFPPAVHAVQEQEQAAIADDRDSPTGSFRITEWRFKSLEKPGADLRTLDPEAAGKFMRSELKGDPESVEAAKKIFARYSFEQIEVLAKDVRVMPTEHKMGLAEARRVMIRHALEVSLSDFEAKTRRVGRFELGALDSGNKGSGIASDVDQTVFLIDKITGDVLGSAEIKEYIKQFNATFEALYGFHPERLGIESMNGADFFPDHRTAHNLLEYVAEAKRVAGEKRPNLEAYRSEGELKSQAEGRGYKALQELGERIVALDEVIKKLSPEMDAFPKENLTPEQKQRGQRLMNRLRAAQAEYTQLKKFSPWTYVGRNEAGKIVVSTTEDPRQTKVLPVEPEMVERFAWDGSYDNWFMFENHPHNRPKYLLRSGAEGPFLLSRLKRSTGAERGPAAVDYDRTPGRKVTAYDYDTEYGRSNHELNKQILIDTYGHLEDGGSRLSVDRIRMAYDAAAKFRLKHKGTPRPDGQPYNIYDVYAEYMSNDTRYPKQIRLQEARARWEVDAREIMIENLMITASAPGEIMQGRFSAKELARIVEQVRVQAPNAPVHAEALRLAAELQLYHGIHDLLSPEHARELVETDPIQREKIRQGRAADLVDRLLAEAEKGAGGKKFRAELERIAMEAATARVNAEINLQSRSMTERAVATAEKLKADAVRLRADLRRYRAEMTARITRLADAGLASYETVARRLREGGYDRETVSVLLLEGLTEAQIVQTRFAERGSRIAAQTAGQGAAHVLGVMGFEGAVVFPNGEFKLSNLKIEFGQPAFSGRKLLNNMFSAGSIYSGLIVLETAIDTDYDPSEVAWAASRELVLRLPYVMAGTAMYELFAHGRPEGASLLLTAYFSPGTAHGFILVSIGVMSVRIGGKVLLAPLEEDNADMIYQGYLAARQGGWVFDAGLKEVMQSSRDFPLDRVKIRVVPYTMTDSRGQIIRHPPEQGLFTESEGPPQTFWIVAPYSFEEAKRLEFASWPDVYDWATSQELLGGEEPWEEKFRLANDPLNNPQMNFEAKRASLFYHYEDEVDEFLCRRGGFIEGMGPCVHDERTDKIETLFAVEGFEGSAAALLPFFRDIIDDWIYRRDEFADPDGGAAEVLIDRIKPKDRPAEREAFLTKLAFRMAGDFLFSYQLLRDGAPGFPGEGSIELGIQQNVRAQLSELARFEANQRMVALGEARKNSKNPELASAIHRVMLDRRPTKGSPRIHIWPRVVNAEQSVGASAAAAAVDLTDEDTKAPPQQVEVIVSVVVNPDSFPPPYKADPLEFIPSWQEDGVHLSVRVTVRDSKGKVIGEPVEKKVGVLEVDEAPAVLEDPVVAACAIAEDAPDEFEIADAADHCDWSVDRILEFDRIALFFTPHRDLGGPDREADEFTWQLLSSAGEPLYGGFWSSGEVPAELSVRIPNAKEGSPARFVVLPNLWGPLDSGTSNPLITGPGGYTVQTAPAELNVDDSMLGNAAARFETAGEWQDEGAFELTDIGLHFKGFVMEPAAAKPIGGNVDVSGEYLGSIEPVKTTVTGSTVSLELKATWRLGTDGQEGQSADSTLYKGHSRMTLEFPQTLAPGRDTEFSVGTRLERLASDIGTGGLPHGFAFELGRMVPTRDSPPDRHLLRGDDIPEPWPSTWRSELNLEGGARLTPAGRSASTSPMAWSHVGTITFEGGAAGEFGAPPRALPWHLRDDATIWVIPVIAHYVSFDCGQEAGCDLSYADATASDLYLTPWSVVGYAIYGPQPGAYSGPLPQGDPVPIAETQPEDGRDSAVAAQADPDQTDPEAETDPAQAAEPAVAVAPSGDDAADVARGAEGPAARIGVVPSIAGNTIAEAEAALRERGLEPNFVAGSMAPSSEQSRTVESVSPAEGTTVDESAQVEVTIYTDFADLADVPPLTGMTIDTVQHRLEAEGLDMEPVVGDPAPSPGLSRKVQRQDPEPDARVERGSTVTVWVHTDYIALATVPGLSGASVQEALRRLEDAGLVFEPAVGDPAPTPSEALTVQRQDPPADAQVAAGSTVTVWIHSEHVPDPVVARAPSRRERPGAEDARRQGDVALPPGTDFYWRLKRQIEGRATVPCEVNCSYYGRLEIYENGAQVFMGNESKGAEYEFRWDDPPETLIPGQVHPVRAGGRLTGLWGWSQPADIYVDFDTERIDRSGKVIGANDWEGQTHRRQIAGDQHQAIGDFRLLGPKLDDRYPEFRVIVRMPRWDSRQFDFATYIYERIDVAGAGAGAADETPTPDAPRFLRIPDSWELDRDAPPRGDAVVPAARIGRDGGDWVIPLRSAVGEGSIEMGIHQGCCDYLMVEIEWFDGSGGVPPPVCEGGWQIRRFATPDPAGPQGRIATLSDRGRRAVTRLISLADEDISRFRPLAEDILSQVQEFGAACR